jgi:hypothetical protein
MQFGRAKDEMTANREFDELAAEFEAKGGTVRLNFEEVSENGLG